MRFFHVLANISSPGNIECALACLRNEACLSFNFAILPYTISELYICQLLPIDKYWNPDRFALSQKFHHYAIPVSLVWNWPIVAVDFSVWENEMPKRMSKSHLMDTFYKVFWNITFGIPQGLIHDPHLFELYISIIWKNFFEDTTHRLFYDNTNISAVRKTIKEGAWGRSL